MEKQDIFKIVVLAAVIVMAVSMFAPSVLQRSNGGTSTTGEVVEGITEFNGTIRTYDPFIAIPLSTNESVLEALKTREGYKSMAFFADSIIVNTTTRDDVYYVASFLKEKGVDAFGIANIALPPSFIVETAQGEVMEVSAAISVVRVPMLVLFEPDSTVSIKMVAGVMDGQLYGYADPVLLSEEKEITVDATVLSEESRIYTYTIPWDERTEVELGELEEYGEVDFDMKNTVLFGVPLTTEEVMDRKSLTYVTYIDQYSIEVLDDFDDSGQILSDFPDNEPSYADSLLAIRTNESIDLDWDYEVLFTYTVALPESAEGIEIGAGNATVVSSEELSADDTLQLNISGVVMGNSFVKITEISTT